jgi:hypothetical protein
MRFLYEILLGPFDLNTSLRPEMQYHQSICRPFDSHQQTRDQGGGGGAKGRWAAGGRVESVQTDNRLDRSEVWEVGRTNERLRAKRPTEAADRGVRAG